jgi:hypothetical protein
MVDDILDMELMDDNGVLLRVYEVDAIDSVYLYDDVDPVSYQILALAIDDCDENNGIDLPLEKLYIDACVSHNEYLGAGPICYARYPSFRESHGYIQLGIGPSRIIVVMDCEVACEFLLEDDDDPIDVMLQIYVKLNDHLPFVIDDHASDCGGIGYYPAIPDDFAYDERLNGLCFPETYQNCMVFHIDNYDIGKSLAIRPCA